MEWLVAAWGPPSSVWLLLGLGGLVGMLSGVGGTGGGFLTTPLLMLVGLPPAVAAAAGAGQVALTIWPGILVHRRLGSLDVKLLLRMIAGSIPGGAAGVLLVYTLRQAGVYDVLLPLMYVPVLAAAAVFFARPGFKIYRPAARARKICSFWVIMALGFGCGVWAAVLGGGGSLPAFALLGTAASLPLLTASGTALAVGALTSAHVVVWQAAINGTVSLRLTLLLAAGAWFGGYLGTRLVRIAGPPAWRRLTVGVLVLMAALLSVGYR